MGRSGPTYSRATGGLTEPIGAGPMIELLSFFEEREAGPLILSDDIAVRKGIDGAGAGGGGEVVKGHGGSATKSLLAAVEEVGFSVFLTGAAE